MLKKSKDQDSILSMSDDDDDEGEYIDPIPSLILTTNPNSYMRIEVRLSFVVETKLPQ